MDRLEAIFAKIVCACAMAVSIPALAQGYPNKPIRVVIPYPPGGGTDTLARPLAQRLTDNLRQQVIIDNRGGANGNIGMEIVAKSPPDGYTLVLALTAQLAVNPSLYRKLPYDPVRDFQPITLLGAGPYTLLVHPSVPAKNVKELIALARRKPGQLAYGSAGNGSGAHLANELLNSMAGVKMVHVPYKGAGPALVDLIAGNLQVLFATYLSCRQHIDAGRVRALAVTTSKRLTGVDIPTIAEAALPGYDAGVWYAILAPAGTPRDIVAKLHDEIVRAATHPDMTKLFANAGIEPINSSPEDLAAYIRSELAKWARVAKEARVEVD
ncbi:MAG: tripartite tricarboxylate transporter substrate binding protein [Rhodospirillaceae bacterium]